MSRQNQVSNTPHSRCLLLELPRELRDLIYLHTLAQEGGIVVYFDERKHRIDVRGRGKQGLMSSACVNPLRLVNRQLARETGTVTFQANDDIALYGVNFANPSSFAFSLFAKQIGVASTSCLRKVAVNGSPKSVVEVLTWKEVSSYFEGFRPFCASHPNTTVILRFRCVQGVKDNNWLTESIALKAIVRGVESIKEPAEINDLRTQQVLSRLGSARAVLQGLPGNLRFSLLDAVPGTGINKETGRPATAMLVVAILPYARELWEEGI